MENYVEEVNNSAIPVENHRNRGQNPRKCPSAEKQRDKTMKQMLCINAMELFCNGIEKCRGGDLFRRTLFPQLAQVTGHGALANHV